MKQFKILEKRGYTYSIESGDKNQIHLDDLIGYNSIFNHKIVYGTLIFFEVIKKSDFKNLNQFSIKIQFVKAFKYNIPIRYNTKKIFQRNFGLAYIGFSKNTEYQYKNEKLNLVKTIKFKNLNFKKKSKSINNKIKTILNNLSWYVGMINPGKYSIINDINLVYDSNNPISDNLKIYSKKINKFPIIKNKIIFDKFNVEFTTSIRPKLKKKKNKVSKKIKKIVQNTKVPILIMGASSGIGKEIFDIYKINKDIDIIATYNKNKFTCDKKNVKIFKLDIKNLQKDIKLILNKYKKLRIYYFLTPKILYTNNNKYKIDEYNNFYLKIPKKIISLLPNNSDLEFFYPSTVLIDRKEKNDYTKSKLIAEKFFKKLNKKNINIKILRIDGVNTKQNLSFLNQQNPNFIELLNKSEKYKNKIFFLNK